MEKKGQDVERRPAMFCRKHLEELLGHPPEEQPVFRRVEGPGEQAAMTPAQRRTLRHGRRELV